MIFTARRSHTLYIEVDETVSGCFDLSPSFSLIGSQALLTGQTALFIGFYAKGMYIDAVDLIL